jgi:hypothetical protein
MPIIKKKGNKKPNNYSMDATIGNVLKEKNGNTLITDKRNY